MIYDKKSQAIVFTNMGTRYALCRNLHRTALSSANLGSMRQISSSPYHDVNYFCRLLQGANIADLRKLLSDDSPNFNAIDEKQVHIRVASLLQNGRIVLFELAQMNAVLKSSSRQVEYEYVDVKETRSSAEIAINRPPTPKVTKVNNDRRVDEPAQVAVLVAAAKTGAPFCEMCSKQEEA